MNTFKIISFQIEGAIDILSGQYNIKKLFSFAQKNMQTQMFQFHLKFKIFYNEEYFKQQLNMSILFSMYTVQQCQNSLFYFHVFRICKMSFFLMLRFLQKMLLGTLVLLLLGRGAVTFVDGACHWCEIFFRFLALEAILKKVFSLKRINQSFTNLQKHYFNF